MEKLFWKILQIPMAYFLVELEAYIFNFTKKEATVGVPQKSIFSNTSVRLLLFFNVMRKSKINKIKQSKVN